MKNLIKSKIYFLYRLPGNQCKEDSECLNNMCLGNLYCIGNLRGESCQSHEDCDVELHCDRQNMCSPLIDDFGKCRDDFDCTNSSGCNHGFCVK